MIRKIFISIFVLLFISNINAQNNVTNFTNKIEKYKYSKYLDSSKYYFKKALPLALKAKDSINTFNIYKHMGDAYEHHLYRDSTLLMYDLCEKYIPKNNTKLKSFLLNDRSYTYNLLHDYETATKLRLKALEISEKAGDIDKIANVSTNLAEGFSKLNLNKQAEQYFKKAIIYSKLSNKKPFLEYSHRYYGTHLLKSKNYNLAFYNLKLASKYAIDTKDSITMAFAWSKLASCYWFNKKVDSCFYFAKKAEGIWERRAENIDLSEVCMLQGEYHSELENFEKAEFYFKKAEKFILNDLYFNEKLFSNFSNLYGKKGNYKLAFQYLSKAKNALEKIRANENNSKVTSLNIKFDTENKEKLIKEQQQKNELANLKLDKKSSQLQIILIFLFFLILTVAIISYFFKKIQSKNKQLENLVNQKKILLKEIHHRVKNNLTTLKSLLFLQAKATDSIEVKAILKESQQRIQSMALIHQNLYEDAETDTVDFHNFIENLFETLESSYKTNDKNIEVTIEKNNVNLEMSTAIFLGLVLNELVTNSYKYAFKNSNSGKINLSLSKINNQLKVIYSDNGIGLAGDFESNTKGFGFKLIRILVQQINAKLNYEYKNKQSVFKITIENV